MTPDSLLLASPHSLIGSSHPLTLAMSVKALRRIADNKKTKNPELSLTGCGLTVLPPELLDCVWLTELNLFWNNELADLSPLATLVNLQRLNCFDTQVADLSPLSALINLQELDCPDTQVEDLSPLADLVNLQGIYCSGTPVTDLSPLSALTNLRQFDCSFTSTTDLSPLLPLIQQGVPVFWKNDYSKDTYIDVEDCPLICPPVEIARDSPQAVRDYFDQDEFGAALAAHRKGDKTIVPIMLRDTDWQDLPLSEIQGVPGVWINSTANQDEAWSKVSKALRPALEQAKQRKRARMEKDR